MHPTPKVYTYDTTKLGPDRCGGANIKIICTVLGCMNAQMTVKTTNSSSFIDKHGQPQGSFKDIFPGIIHMSLGPYILNTFWKNQLYPYFEIEGKIISLKNPQQFAKILLFISHSDYLMFLVAGCLLSILILKYILNKPLIYATLEFLRMLVGASTLRQPRNLIGKTFLIVFALIAFAIICTLIQGLLSAAINVPSHALIDSLYDLIEANISIYGIPSHLKTIVDATLRDRLYVVHINDVTGYCTHRFLQGDNVACIQTTTSIVRRLWNESPNIHISKENVFRTGLTYTCAEDSPFIPRMNWILSRLNEGGFIAFLQKRDELHYSGNLDRDLPKGLDVGDFTFEFCIFFVALELAVFIFLMELVVWKINQRIGKLRFKPLRVITSELKERILNLSHF